MAIALCRDGIYSDHDRAMSHATLWTWEAACDSWREWPPLHVRFALWTGHKPPARASAVPIDMSILDKPLDPNVVKAMRGERVDGAMSIDEFVRMTAASPK